MSSPEQPKSPADLVGWTPFQIEPRPDNIYVHWIQLGDLNFADPFFGQTVERRLQDPARQVVTTPITALAEVAGLAQSLPPGAFVFHCARAGSTLLQRMLGSCRKGAAKIARRAGSQCQCRIGAGGRHSERRSGDAGCAAHGRRNGGL